MQFLAFDFVLVYLRGPEAVRLVAHRRARLLVLSGKIKPNSARLGPFHGKFSQISSNSSQNRSKLNCRRSNQS
eukprot:1524473-Rhodomonas_salina.1